MVAFILESLNHDSIRVDFVKRLYKVNLAFENTEKHQESWQFDHSKFCFLRVVGVLDGQQRQLVNTELMLE